MELKADLVRNLLLYVETLKYGETAGISKVFNSLNLRDEDEYLEVVYTVKKLIEAGYLIASTSPLEICEMTYNGHMFLETIRDNKVWEQTKKKAASFTGVSFEILKDIATSIIKKHFELN
ncbi:DUF2513 domain-containing protein [Bacillus halotolerans]|uniref:DUF2513 domain-containing protein n=1 Tax=Bacillus halotolerans TaxID=260554 RepID=UPI001300C0C3|nr:DUF2513 domain-containing protein [Bacillus halotolerans]MBU5245293.1 DUF2513 domain-containing protein [Bacillus halotolerans]